MKVFVDISWFQLFCWCQFVIAALNNLYFQSASKSSNKDSKDSKSSKDDKKEAKDVGDGAHVDAVSIFNDLTSVLSYCCFFSFLCRMWFEDGVISSMTPFNLSKVVCDIWAFLSNVLWHIWQYVVTIFVHWWRSYNLKGHRSVCNMLVVCCCNYSKHIIFLLMQTLDTQSSMA